MYDASNKPAIVDFNGTQYAYVHDLQGDICQIVDCDGNVVVAYTYDAWGKVLNITGDEDLKETLGKIQPFRYRGYVYDVETGVYYLRSRYYNPERGRFFNADSVEPTKKERPIIDYNKYAYCCNHPIVSCDTNGKAAAHVIGAIVGAVSGVALGTLLQMNLDYLDGNVGFLLVPYQLLVQQ